MNELALFASSLISFVILDNDYFLLKTYRESIFKFDITDSKLFTFYKTEIKCCF